MLKNVYFLLGQHFSFASKWNDYYYNIIQLFAFEMAIRCLKQRASKMLIFWAINKTLVSKHDGLNDAFK